MIDDNATDEAVDGSSTTYEAKLVNVMITNHPVIGGRRHDCNSILFAKRQSMITPLEVIDDKTSVYFSIEKDPHGSSENTEDRFFKLDLAVKVFLLYYNYYYQY